MALNIEPGLGELLRYAAQRVERGAGQHCRKIGLSHQARCTPVLRAIEAGARTTTEITACTHFTQVAISQTLRLVARESAQARQHQQVSQRLGAAKQPPAAGVTGNA